MTLGPTRMFAFGEPASAAYATTSALIQSMVPEGVTHWQGWPVALVMRRSRRRSTWLSRPLRLRRPREGSDLAASASFGEEQLDHLSGDHDRPPVAFSPCSTEWPSNGQRACFRAIFAGKNAPLRAAAGDLLPTAITVCSQHRERMIGDVRMQRMPGFRRDELVIGH